MKKRTMRLLSVMLGLCMAASGRTFAASGPEMIEMVEIWTRTDIILNSEKTYKNPYTDVDIDAVFTHEDGTQIALYGFWNGGDEWRVRFSPTKTGIWTYVVTCSDEENAGLHNKTGKIRAVANTGATDIDRHGFIKISENGRYFVHDDGTPFYWLGDTNWQAPNYVSISKCNYPGCNCGNQFFHEVNDRADKGFTVYQTYFDSSESDGGGQIPVTPEPSMWTAKYTKINPKTFSNKYDVMFDYLAAKGMVIALGFGVHDITVKNMGTEALDRLSRYLTARYAAYPVVWITAQEITGSSHFDAWVSSARITSAGDGYNHPQSAHQYPLDVNDTFIKKLDAEDWHDFYALQSGHGALFASKTTYQGYWTNRRNKDAAKPFVETEANYEDIYCGGFNGYDASRISAWKANLCGSCGFTYGVTGIWANCWSTAGSTGWMGTYSTEPWYMGLDKPGSYEMKYMADFFRYVGFSSLEPRYSNTQYSNLKEETKVLASSEDNKTYVAYFYNSDLSTGTLKKLNVNEKYSAKWYDVLTGKFIKISDDIPHEDGKYVIPDKPDTSDWALLVTSRTDLGEYVTEAQRPYEPVISEENILAGAAATASSVSTGSSGADKATDGRGDTWWCASNGSFPQWIRFDLGSVKKFDTFAIQLYHGTGSTSYTLEISNDGTHWETVHRGENELPKSTSAAIFEVSLGKIYECRYMKYTFTKVTANWAAMIEADAHVTVPKNERIGFEGVIQTPGITCTGSYIYSADGKGKNTAEYLTDGDLSTEWKPFAPESTQSVILDLYESKDVYGVEIVPGKNSELTDYRVEGSEDGADWTVIANSPVNGKNTFKTDGGNIISEAINGKYRYIKIIFMGASGKKSVKTVAEIKLYAKGATAEAPAKADVTELTKLYTDCKKIKNGSASYSGAAFRDFLIALGDAAKAVSHADTVTAQEVKSAENALNAARENLNKPKEEPFIETVPVTEAKETEPEETDTKTTQTEEAEPAGSNGKFPVGAVAAAVAGAAACTAAALIIRKKIDKKREKGEK